MAISKTYLTSLVKNILITEEESEFNVGDAFQFIKDKTGKRPPLIWLLTNKPEDIEKEDLYLDGDLELYSEDAGKLTYLPEGLHVNGDCFIMGAYQVDELPRNIFVEKTLNIDGGIFENVPKGFKGEGQTQIFNAFFLQKFEDGSHFRNLYLKKCDHIETISNISISNSLRLKDCTNLKVIPNTDKLKDLQYLEIENCRNLRHLPDNLVISEKLSINYLCGLVSFPRNLRTNNFVVDYETPVVRDIYHRNGAISRETAQDIIRKEIEDLGGIITGSVYMTYR